MPTIRDNTIDDLLLNLNDWAEYSPDNTSQLFISTVGFEDRTCVGFKLWANAGGSSNRNALLIVYPTNPADNDRQIAKYTEAAQASRITTNEIQYKAASFYGEITATLRGVTDPRSIVIDISTMASYVFYPLMKAIYDSNIKANIQILYSEAEKYFPTIEEWDKFKESYARVEDLFERAKLFDEQHFQSTGVDNIYESPVFPGMNLDKLPGALIMVPNFSYERVQRMVNFASDRYTSNSSNDIFWMIGIPPDQAINGWRHDALWEMYGKPSEMVSVSTFLWKEMLQQLNLIWLSKQYQKAMMIGTVGSKPQHLGTFLFLKMHPEVGLILSEPKEYSAGRYTEGYKKVWSITLGDISELNEKLRTWNTLAFNW